MFKSAVLRGIDALPVEIEVAIGRALGFQIVGLGRPAVREGRERLRNAILASGFKWPGDSSTIRKRVESARTVQQKRFEETSIKVNARIPGGRVHQFCELQPSALSAMREVAKRI